MTNELQAEVLFGVPWSPLAPRLRDLWARAEAVDVVVGFVTVDGIQALASEVKRSPEKLKSLVIGAATQRAFDAIDALVASGVPSDNVHVHLGHTRFTKTQAPKKKYTGGKRWKPFYDYHPMLHGKIYYFHLPHSQAAAIVGSHNLTSYALLGKNGEASVLLSGPASHGEFAKLRSHIAAAQKDATRYSPVLKDGYAWWYHESFDGMAWNVYDRSRDYRFDPAVVLLAQKTSDVPQRRDIVYFELPSALRHHIFNAPVHLYVFDELPADPVQALASLGRAKALLAETKGLESDGGGIELDVRWDFSRESAPDLTEVAGSLKPNPAPSYQQVRARVLGDLPEIPAYLFTVESTRWRAKVDESKRLEATAEDHDMLAPLGLIPPQHLAWQRVVGVEPTETWTPGYRNALEECSPSSGNFVLLPLWQKKAR